MVVRVITNGLLAVALLAGCKDTGAASPPPTEGVAAPAESAPAPNQAAAAPTEAAAVPTEASPTAEVPKASGPVIDHKVQMLDGKETALSEWRGHTLLIVNTASECGLTPQYEDLEALYQRYSGRGLVVMGFPSNDFGGQEPGDNKQISEFVAKTFGITFPMFDKQVVKGSAKSPLYKTLTEDLGGPLSGEITWNFEKFLVGPDGHVVARFPPRTKPLDPVVTAAIEANLPPSGK